MDFDIEPEVCASEKGAGENLIEIIGDVLGEYHAEKSVDHWFTDVEMDIPTCPLSQTDENVRMLQPVQYRDSYSESIEHNKRNSQANSINKNIERRR